MKITLLTGNAGKLKEFQDLLPGIELVSAKVPLVEIQALDVAHVAKEKALAAFQQLSCPVLVDDSCIIVDEWNGLPGALTSWFMDAVGNEGILSMATSLARRDARVKTVLAYCDQNCAEVFEGELPGTLSSSCRGTNGFGFDPIFIPSGQPKTLAEHTDAEKNAISMRKLAADKFLAYWNAKQ